MMLLCCSCAGYCAGCSPISLQSLTLTIPQKYSKNKNSCFPAGCADSAVEDGKSGSNVYEVNTWLWQFGRGKPLLGSLIIEETSKRLTSVGRRLLMVARVMVPDWI